MKLVRLREEIVAACVDFYKNGLVRNIGAGGNISARDPESGLIALTPSQVRYDIMKPEDIVIINLKGEVVEAKPSRRPTSEEETHRLIYERYSSVNAVIHTHSIYANVLATLYDEIPVVNNEVAYFIGGPVPVIDYVEPGTRDMAIAVAEGIKEIPAVVIRNHGPIVAGRNLAEALTRALVVEDAAKIYIKARCLGEPKLMSQEEWQQLWAKSYYNPANS